MLIREFESRTGIYPSWALWKSINRAYNESALDKDKFCADYLANMDGLAEHIQSVCNIAAGKAESEQRRKLFAAQTKIRVLEERLEKLTTALDRELDWHLSEDTGTNLAQDGYNDRAESSACEELTNLVAMRKLHKLFGFDMARITIVETARTFEVNKHGKLRVKDTYTRRPLWGASDWNYIRFDCAGCQWECIDGELKPYYD